MKKKLFYLDHIVLIYFYYNMHLPYISERHGDAAIKKSYKDMKKSFDNGELLQINFGQKMSLR